MSPAATWKESIIGNSELVIHLTRTFHLSLSQRHSCLILWVAVAQQMWGVSIGKWVLLVLFSFSPPSLTVSIEVCGGTWVPLRWAFLGLLVQFSFPAGWQGLCLREGRGVSAVMCGTLLAAPAAGTLQGGWNLAGPADNIHGELFRTVFGKGKPGEGGMLVWRGSQGVHVQTQLCFHLISQQKCAANG